LKKQKVSNVTNLFATECKKPFVDT
jgi:hypothetical protein